jgi:hypothetical protein
LKTLNIFPMKPSGVQLAKATRPPGFVTRTNSAATTSGRGANMTPNMLTTRSNCSGRIRQRLGVAFLEIDLQTFRICPGAGLLDEIAGDVDAADHAPSAGGENREISRAASGVEDLRARVNRLPGHEVLGDILDGAGNLPKVAGLPKWLSALP